MSTVKLPFCKYNNSLNKYLFHNTNTSVDLDFFPFYKNFNNELSSAKRFFLNVLIPHRHSSFGGVPTSLSQTLSLFAHFLISRLKINPFHELWEPTLATWATFPGGSLLACCQSQYEDRQEKFARIRASLEKAAALQAKRELERKKRLLVPLLAKLAMQVRREEAICLRDTLYPANETVGTEEIARAAAAQKKAADAVNIYAVLCRKVWRVKRQQRREKRLEKEAAIMAAYGALVPVAEVVPTICKAPRVRPSKERHFVVPTILGGLYPVLGLGTKNADPVCRVLRACEPIAASRPDLVSCIYAFITGEGAAWSTLKRATLLCERIVKLSDWYPHELLAEELKKISDEESCKEAERTIGSEYARLATIEENMRATTWWETIKSTPARILSSIVDFTLSPLKKYAACAAEYIEGFSTGVLNALSQKIDEVLRQVSSHLGVAQQMMNQIAGHVKEWFNNICKSMDETLHLLGKWVGYALALIVGVGLCHLVEVVLGQMGVHIAGLLTTGFSTCFLGWMFTKTTVCHEWITSVRLSVAHMAREFFCTQRNELHRAGFSNARIMEAVPYEVPVHAFAGTEDQPAYNARSIPVVSPIISAMSSFGTSLLGIKSGALVEFGKLGAACHSLRMGKEALCEFVSSVLYYFGRIADKITGRETEFFDQLSLLAQVDMRDWIKRARGVIMEANYTSLNNMVLSDVVNKVVADGHRLQVSAAGTPRKLSLDFGQLVSTIMKDLLDLQERIVRHGTTIGRRKEPCWIYIYGESHCGKSNIMDYLTLELCNYFEIPYTYCARNSQDHFFTTGYKRQSVLQIDDLSAVITEPPLEGELINLVACAEYPLKMADLNDKSISFQSPFIISTSNLRTCPTTCGINDLSAYNNRRAVVIQMRRKPGAQYDPNDSHAAMQARFEDKRDNTPLFANPGDPESAWKSIPEMTTMLLNMCAEHRKEQDILQAQHERRHMMNDPLIVSSSKFLRAKSVDLLCYMTRIEMERHGVEHEAQGCYYLCVDNKLYVCDGVGELKEAKCANPDYARWEAESMKGFLTSVQNKDLLESRSMIVTAFLRNLVQGQCSILGVDEMSTTATIAQQSVFRTLQLQEKIYLRLVQKKINPILSEEGQNVYSKSAWDRCLEFVASTRDYLKEHGLEVLLLAAAMCLLSVSLYHFLGALIGLLGGSLSFGAAVAGIKEVDMKAQMSSGAQESRYRSRNVPVHHRYRYAKGDHNEEIPLAGQLCVALYGSNGRFVSALQYKGRSIMLTRHQMCAFKEKERVTCIYLSTGESVVLTFSRDSVQEFGGHETCLWEASGMLDLPHKFKDCFLENSEVDLAPAFEMEGFVLRPDESAFHYDHLKTWARVQYEPFVVRGQLEREKYVNELPQSVWFSYKSRNNDCGMLLLAQVKGKQKVVGLLVAGANTDSWGDILPTPHMATMKSQIDYNFELGVHTEGYTKLGYLNPGNTPHLPKKNCITHVREELLIASPVPVKEPSVISAEDVRCPEGVDPITKAFEKKFTTPMSVLDDALVDEIAAEILEEWQDCEPSFLEDVSLEVAINGIQVQEEDEFSDAVECFVMRTSPGYPYVIDKDKVPGMKGKEQYFELSPDGTRTLKANSLAAELHENIMSYSKVAVPELVVIECPKDELLKTEKVRAGACRLFEIMPLHYNLALRQKTLAFSQFQQKHRSKLSCQVGISPYSREWTHLYQRLISKNTVAINCDYSGFDGLMSAQMVHTIAKMINAMYASPTESEVSQRQRYNLICALYGRVAILKNQVMRVRAGIPSGFALTVVINSIFNEILMRYSYKLLVPAVARNSFSTYVTLIVYGDDNLMSCTPTIAKSYNGAAIKDLFKKYNITITDGSDKTAASIEWKPLNELDFLKRRFLKLESGVIQAPLDLSAIYSCLHWITPNPHKLEAQKKPELFDSGVDISYELALNVQVALTELYLHNDRESFLTVRNFFKRKLPIMEYHTWADREAFHMAKQTAMEAYQPAKELDVEIGQDFARFMHVSDIGNKVHWYTPLLGVAGPFYRPKETEVVISTLPLKEGECGYYIPVEKGTGGGGLPTIVWVKRFGRPSALRDAYGYMCYDSLRAHVEAGKSLVFRGPAPYVANNAALISFGSAAGFLKQNEALHLYRNVIPESTTGLQQYFDEPIPVASLPGKSFFANEESTVLLQDFKNGETLSFPLPERGSAVERVRQCIINCQRANKTPVFCATSLPNGKCYVGMACSKAICATHVCSSTSIREAFHQCWKMRCASSAARKKYDFSGIKDSLKS